MSTFTILSVCPETGAEAGVPFLFKQWGEFSDFDHIGMDWNDLPDRIRRRQQFVDGKAMVQIGKKRAGRLLDGVQHDGYPEVSHVLL